MLAVVVYFLLVPWSLKFIIPILTYIPISIFGQNLTEDSVIITLTNYFLPLAVLSGYFFNATVVFQRYNRSSLLSLEYLVSQWRIFRREVSNNKYYIILVLAGSIMFPLLRYLISYLLSIDIIAPMNLPVVLVTGLLFGPLVEEFLFRKTLFSVAESKGIKNIPFVSALLFSLAHGYSFTIDSLLVLIENFFVSYLFLALPYSRKKCIVLPIISHIILNASVIVFETGFGSISMSKGLTILMICLLSSILIIIAPFLLTQTKSAGRIDD